MKNNYESDGQFGQNNCQATWLETVRSQIASLRFGVVQIVVHDSQVMQIKRTEKVHLDRKPLES